MALPTPDPAAQARAFEALRRRFVDGLAARWALIEGAADPAACAGELHRLAGAAGGYGFAALDAAARAALAAASAPGPGLAAALQEVRAAIDAAARDTVPSHSTDPQGVQSGPSRHGPLAPGVKTWN